MQTIQMLAPHLRDDQFRFLPAQHGELPDLAPLISAGVWILSHVADNVVADYYIHYGRESVTERVAMVRRLHADLDLTASKIPRLQ
jgi:hypothetical protein